MINRSAKPTGANTCPAAQGKGFTLVELLVVISIIAILAAILFPVFGQAKVAAKAAVGKSHGHELGLATHMYLIDYDGTYPVAAYATSKSYVTWPNLLQPYVKNNEIWWYPGSIVSKYDGDGRPTSHWGYNAHYLTTVAYDFSNVASQIGINEVQVNDSSASVLFTSAHASVAHSWCGDDGKYLLPPSGANVDCWGRPDLVLNLRSTVVWLDCHTSARLDSGFYTGTTPPDLFFALR